MPYYSSAGNAEYIANIAENKLIQKTPNMKSIKTAKDH